MNDVRIMKVEARTPTGLFVRFKGSVALHSVDLAGWIKTGGDILSPLRDPQVFAHVSVGDHGAAVTWDDGEGDLSIDAVHLKMIVDEQKPFGNEDVRKWQSRFDLSNAEAADLVGVSPSTWATYKTDASIPKAVALTLRASQRDPLFLQAHLRPRTTGRPRKEMQ
ncbi:hypothetical protein AFIC_001030 [[Pseudomonas] carboxydohydrogena]|uniref:DUF2442 domain-containing protein n=1 Tax=Afipia carboxydohydrogena TaxID=290 RepID=A0ABY8BRB5_AFICR|nr:hypothetical protein [[Pseudomonas] carboxydohydrogena]WEF52539.1 hypothetical protein AFIC_001030 [[Pseudomonas] carboxydohydrogena]